jgi:hypothetical protein
MPRFGLRPLVGVSIIALLAAFVSADPPQDEQTRKLQSLAVHQAMAAARQQLRDSQPKRAIEVLEEQLPRANGHQGYLELLRDAYRDYIMKLSLDRESVLAQRYLERLRILDPQAARELTVSAEQAPVKFEARPTPPAPPMPLPNFAENHPATKLPAAPASGQPRAPTIVAAVAGAKPITARGKVDEAREDPFDLANQRPSANPDAAQVANQLVIRANEEFTRHRYKEARQFYEQAFQADQHRTDSCRDNWAYCMLNDVVETLNRPSLDAKALSNLQKDVHGALAISQAPMLTAEAQKLLREIDQRRCSPNAAGRPVQEYSVSMQHYGRNPQGWQVTDTPHFRIYHNQPRDLVERVAQIAERTRSDVSRKWFGNDGADWQGRCELVLHATAADYSKSEREPITSPGHSRIESDPITHRVVSRQLQLHVDHPGMLEAVLPHEATHVVLAGQFGPFQVPRWADEGMAVLSEPQEKIEQHRQNLVKAAREGQLFGVKELLELENYPKAHRIGAFYAQSVALVEFLAQQRGPTIFSDFVRDGLRNGWDAAARKHYQWDLAEMQQRFTAQVQGDAQRLLAGSR